jgi:hypothetical protein
VFAHSHTRAVQAERPWLQCLSSFALPDDRHRVLWVTCPGGSIRFSSYVTPYVPISEYYQGPDRLILLSSAVGRIRRVSGSKVRRRPHHARTHIDDRPKVYLYRRSVSYSSHLSPPRPYSTVTHVREICLLQHSLHRGARSENYYATSNKRYTCTFLTCYMKNASESTGE